MENQTSPVAYTFYSGGADGSDTIWEKIANEYKTNFIILSFPEHGLRISSKVIELASSQLQDSNQHISRANTTLRRNITNISNFASKLLQRNWHIVKDADAIFAITNLDEKFGKCKGGTGWPVQMAIDNNKLVYVFDMREEKWFHFVPKKNKFLEYEHGIPKLSFSSALVGARDIKACGKKAIREVFKATFG